MNNESCFAAWMFYAVCVEELAHQNWVHASVQTAQTHQGRQRHCDQQTHLELELRHRNTHTHTHHTTNTTLWQVIQILNLLKESVVQQKLVSLLVFENLFLQSLWSFINLLPDTWLLFGSFCLVDVLPVIKSLAPLWLCPPSFTYGDRFCSHLNFNNSEKRGLVYSFTSFILPSCALPPPPLPFFLCLFLSFAAGSLFTGSSWREVFKNSHKGCQGQEGGSLCDWLSWPLTCFGNRANCLKALCLFTSFCDSSLVIYRYACSFLSGESLGNVRPQLSSVLPMGPLTLQT